MKGRRKIFAILALAGVLTISMIPAAQASAKANYKLTGNKAKDVVGIAASCEGLKLTGAKKKLKSYKKKLFRPGYKGDWCAWFVANCAKEAGVSKKAIPRSTSAPAYERWAKKKGLYYSKKSYKPKVGDLAVYYNGGHVEIVASVSKKGVKTIGGNTGNSPWPSSKVSKPRSYSALSGYIKIKYPSPVYSHKFSYNLNGGTGTFQTVTVKDNKNLTIPAANPVKTGYTFTGWSVERSDKKWNTNNGWATADVLSSKGYTKVLYGAGISYKIDSSWTKGKADGNYTFHANWNANTYTVRYDANGGTGSMADTKHTYGVQSYLAKSVFEREGYIFDNWNVYRQSDNKWLYGNGSDSAWYQKDNQPAGYSLYTYNDGGYISTTTPVNNDVVILYAKWIKDVPVFSSEWSETRPPENDSHEIEFKTQYRYRDRTLINSGKESVEGFEKVGSETVSTSYGDWSPSSEGRNTGSYSENDDYNTTVNVEEISAFKSYTWYCPCGKYGSDSAKTKCPYCGELTNYKYLNVYSSVSLSDSGYNADTSYNQTRYELPESISLLDPGKLGTIYCMRYESSAGTGVTDSFTSQENTGVTSMWEANTAKVSRTITVISRNEFEQWSDWSEWSDKEYVPTSERQVEKRTLYRYKPE